MNTNMKVVLGVLLGIVVVCIGFIGGFAVAKFSPSAVALPQIVSAEPEGVAAAVDEVAALLQSEALEPPTETSATAGALNGLLESGGDKYATYFDAKHYKFFNEESQGEFGGIGVSLGDKDGSAYVVEVFPDTPAERAGIKPGDEFQSIDGVKRAKWTTEEVVKRVRGEAGTTVKLVFWRPGKEDGEGKEFKANVERAMIEYPNVTAEMKGDVGYIEISQFNARAAEDISQSIKDLEKKGAKAYVLDLRNNPGGLLDQAVDVSSLFIDKGVIVSVEERGKDPIEYRATGGTATDAPLVVLVNGNSASASEIVAGALQDTDRATLVGEKTFGKGSVQTVKELSSGGAVKFTIAHYLTPKNREIDGKGLTPDVVVKMDIEDQMEESTDTQLKRALALAAKAAR